MRLTCEGKDNLGTFVIFNPDHCGICEENVEAGLFYGHRSIKTHLKELNILAKDLICFKPKGKGIIQVHTGITCGCYAKLQRQIAHISDKKSRHRSHETTAQASG